MNMSQQFSFPLEFPYITSLNLVFRSAFLMARRFRCGRRKIRCVLERLLSESTFSIKSGGYAATEKRTTGIHISHPVARRDGRVVSAVCASRADVHSHVGAVSSARLRARFPGLADRLVQGRFLSFAFFSASEC